MRHELESIWTSVLGVPVSDDSDFFELGGHSLLAAQVVALARQRLDRPIPLALIFEKSRFCDFCIALERLPQG